MDAQSTSGDWEDVSLEGLDPSLAAFFQAKGLGKFAQKIAEATDAESVDDLRLIDESMAEDIIRTVDLKLVSAKKFRMALAELRGEVATPSGPAAASAAAAVPSPEAAAAVGPEASSPKAAAEPPIAPPDADADAAAAANPGAVPAETPQATVDECVVICIDRSGSMGSPFAEITLNVVKGAVAQRSRMEAVKAMFYAFRDRTESVDDARHYMGLVQFDDRVERLLDLTPRLDRFESIVDNVEKRGQTAIYSAILEGVAMLESHYKEDSQTDLRVLVLTDGQNNTGAAPEMALDAVNRIGATVDAIIVGDRPDANLRRIVSATDGECYQIASLGEGFELLEAEGVVSLRARRGGADKPPPAAREARQPVDFGTIQQKAITKGTEVKRAPAEASSSSAQPVVAVSKVVAAADSGDRQGPVIKRVLRELKDLAGGAPEGLHVFPAPDNLKFWRALIEGPRGSPFEGGVFAVSIQLPDDYPFKPPKVRFETPVYHCNVNDSGNVCLDILKDSWSPALSVVKCLLSMRSLLQDPNPDDALRQWIAELTIAHQNHGAADTRYPDNARAATLKDASVTVEEWKQRWGC